MKYGEILNDNSYVILIGPLLTNDFDEMYNVYIHMNGLSFNRKITYHWYQDEIMNKIQKYLQNKIFQYLLLHHDEEFHDIYFNKFLDQCVFYQTLKSELLESSK